MSEVTILTQLLFLFVVLFNKKITELQKQVTLSKYTPFHNHVQGKERKVCFYAQSTILITCKIKYKQTYSYTDTN